MELIFHLITHILRIFISNCGINNIFSVVLKSIWVVIDFIFHELVVSYKRSGGVIWHLIMFTIILENT